MPPVAAPVAKPVVMPVEKPIAEAIIPPATATLPTESDPWSALLAALNLGGITYALASQCVFKSLTDDNLVLNLSPKHKALLHQQHIEFLSNAVSEHLGHNCKVVIEVAEVAAKTPAILLQEAKSKEREVAIQQLQQDPGVQQLASVFDAKLDVQSVELLD